MNPSKRRRNTGHCSMRQCLRCWGMLGHHPQISKLCSLASCVMKVLAQYNLHSKPQAVPSCSGCHVRQPAHGKHKWQILTGEEPSAAFVQLLMQYMQRANSGDSDTDDRLSTGACASALSTATAGQHTARLQSLAEKALKLSANREQDIIAMAMEGACQVRLQFFRQAIARFRT